MPARAANRRQAFRGRGGTLAEYVAIEARNLAPLPGDVDIAAIDHITAAPPSSVMNSRRLILEGCNLPHRCMKCRAVHLGKLGRPMFEVGQSRRWP
jgi:hypothetical protein